MKTKYLFTLLFCFFSFLLLQANPKTDNQLKTASGKTIYGWGTWDKENFAYNSWKSFDITDVSKLTELAKFPKQAWGATVVGHYLYCFMQGPVNDYYKATQDFMRYDLRKNPFDAEPVKIASYLLQDLDSPDAESYYIKSLTYDYTTNTMYATADTRIFTKKITSIFCSINIETGEMTKIADIPTYIRPIACNRAGEIYGIEITPIVEIKREVKGSLVKINKSNGTTQFVGALNLPTMGELQGLEFDRDNNNLYWATDNGVFARVNTQTAAIENLGTFYRNQSFSCIHIPFSPLSNDVPNAVTDLNIQTGANGALSATISFKAPAKTVGDANLAVITSIEIFRDGESIKKIDNPSPGASLSHTDNVSDTKYYGYKIVATNAKGEGQPKAQDIFIGEDFPGNPTGIILSSSSKPGRGAEWAISWTAPVSGLNGGWFNNAQLSYDVVRMPGNTLMATGLKSLSYTDETDLTTLKLEKYYYTISAKTDKGSSRAANSADFYNMGIATAPYVFEFDSEDEFSTWQVIDANNDNATWKCEPSLDRASYTSHQTNAADDYLVSPSVRFEKNVPYRIHFKFRRKNTSTPEKIRVYYGEKIGSGQDQTLLLEYTLSSKQDTNFAIEFIPTEDGIYKIAFQAATAAPAISAPGATSTGMEILEFEVVEYNDHDLAISDLELKFSSAMAERSSPLIMTVENVGALDQEKVKYSVMLLVNGEYADSKNFEREDLWATEYFDIQMNWTPAPGLSGKVEIQAVISLTSANDPNAKNDTSNLLIVYLRPFSEKDTANIIYKSDEEAEVPISFKNRGSISQSLYLAGEIEFYGAIDKFSWYYNNTSGKTVKQPIQVYMGSMKEDELDKVWLSASERQLVFDDSITLEPGMDKELIINLSRSYIYDRDNLSIIVVKNNENTFKGITFRYNYGDGQTIRLFSLDQELDLNNSEPTTEVDYAQPAIKIVATTACGTFWGNISDVEDDEDGDMVPIVNAEISLNEVFAPNIQSDAYGVFEQAYIPVGTYTAKVTALGYFDTEVEDINITRNAGDFVMIQMQKLDKFVLTGLVSFDGKPLADARVKISGYDTKVVYTGADGKFSMTDMYGEKAYILEISKAGAKTYREPLMLAMEDKEINITLVAASYTPQNVVASTTATVANITWENPALTEYRYDGGVRTSQTGFGGNSTDYLYGVMYKGAIILDSISWFVTSEGGPHTEVNVYVLDLDASGKPTTKVLFSQMDVPNTDLQWTSFGLPLSLECPNGFVVALNYPGFLGIGTDDGSVSGYPFVSGVNYQVDLGENIVKEYLRTGGNTNLMIRAKGHPYGTPKPAVNSKIKNNTAHISGIEYQVYRFFEKDAAKESAWTLLTPTAISAKSYADNTWGSIPDEAYQYAVKAVYATEYSAAALSNMVHKGMTVQIKIELSANSDAKAADGASVRLVNNSGDTRWVYNGLVKDGKLSFDSLWKGSYTLKIEQPKFAPILKENLDLTRAQTLSYTLEQVIMKPFNLAITATDNQLERNFTWNTSVDIMEDFESHANFTINSPGTIGWNYIDGDGAKTYGIGAYWRQVPVNERPMAYFILNPFVFDPPIMESEYFKELAPRSGKNLLVSMSAVNTRNADYFISPELNFAHDFEFSFWARGFDKTEEMKVGYSTTGKETKDFTYWLSPGNSQIVKAEPWKEYTYTLPYTAKYVTIECVSSNRFMFMVDDVFIGSKAGKSEMLTYEIYLDGAKVADADTNHYLFSNLTEGKEYTAGVKSKYASGLSEMSTIKFTATKIANDDMQEQTFKIYPNPSKDVVYIQGEYDHLEIFDLSGKLLKRQSAGKETISIGEFMSGSYILKVYQKNNRISHHKLIKK